MPRRRRPASRARAAIDGIDGDTALELPPVVRPDRPGESIPMLEQEAAEEKLSGGQALSDRLVELLTEIAKTGDDTIDLRAEPTVILGAAAGPAYGFGLWSGSRLFGRADEITFRRICYGLIAGAAILGLPLLDGILR